SHELKEFKEHEGKSFNPAKIIFLTIFNFMTTLLVGKQYDTESELFMKLVEFEGEVRTPINPVGKGVELDIFPWLKYFGHPAYKKMQSLVQTKDDLWRIVNRDQDGESCFATALCTAQEESVDRDGANCLTDKHLMMPTIDMLLAGTSSTVNTFYCYLNIISHHPDIQTRIQEEVDQFVGRHRQITPDDKRRLPYTQAVMLELLRYTSVSAFTILHRVLKNTTISGKKVSAGAILLANLWALHHDHSFWDAPYDFRPERFLEADGSVVSPSHVNRHLLPFGAGPRVCVGEILAKTRLFLMVAHLAQCCTVSPGNVKSAYDPREYPVSMFLSPKKYEVIVQMRQ
ncbi:hypothetical protein CAPTEDRAFT_97015, partial [Capitella teleta]